MSPLVGCPGPGEREQKRKLERKLERKLKLSGGLLSGGLMPVPPKFNAYTHRLGFLCVA